MAGKMHELLAIEGPLKIQATTVLRDLAATFRTRHHLFNEKKVTVTFLAENMPAELTEQSAIETTVPQEIAWIRNILERRIDASYAIDLANTHANASIIDEAGTVLFPDVPATALLRLEGEFNELKTLLMALPTLDPSKGFVPDPNHSLSGVYKAREVQKEKTKKIKEVLVLAPATDKHPAQVQVFDKDAKIGTILEQEWSAMIQPSMKAALIEQCESLIRAIKKARSRANDHILALQPKIASTLLDFVLIGLPVVKPSDKVRGGV